MAKRVLLVENEVGLVMTLTDRLQAEGYSVESRTDGEQGLLEAGTGTYDVIILDVMLPRKSGFDVCRKVREQGIDAPILMLTARNEVVDKVVGLQCGADDYLTKPFDMMELLARLEALQRRPSSHVSKSTFRFGSVLVDFRTAQVTRDGAPVNLSAREFQLLKYLIENRGALLSREQLLGEVWGYRSMPLTRTVDVHMAWLRQKLEMNPKHPEFFLTVRGLGYRFAA
jgi:two-component system alkaline phosphatase synthesis response regulator PhoP